MCLDDLEESAAPDAVTHPLNPRLRLYLQLCAAEDASTTPQHTQQTTPDSSLERIIEHMEKR